MKINREQIAAVAIDYQERLIPAMREKEALVKNTSILMEGLRVLDIPICLTQQYTKGLGNTVPEITEAAGTSEFFDKISYSAYEHIESFVKEKSQVILCGMESHICVLQTLIDLRERGFEVILVVDCIDSRKEQDKKYAIERAKAEGAVLTTYEALLFELLGKAGTDEAKKIQKLIK
ncbi:MAG: isochorismatase family protein [Hespellia sp.]|nr:isochorismatase family protein [Hespellia sp.]